MIILSHRGYWKEPQEKNQAIAFERSFSMGFGTETDIRDFNENLTISHDIANRHSLSAETLFQIYQQYQNPLPLALNIKADGLQNQLKMLLEKYHISQYFVFDMSIPDTIGYLNAGLTVFTRQSEYEPTPAFYDQVQGVWMDGFESDWIQESHIAAHLNAGKQVCLVSPDLHKRPYELFWSMLKSIDCINNQNLMLCTDYPEIAEAFFKK